MAEFVHAKTNVAAILHAIPEGEQREAGPAMAHVEGGGGAALEGMLRADNPGDAVAGPQCAGFGLFDGGEEKGGFEVPRNIGCDGFCGHWLRLGMIRRRGEER